MAGSLVGLFAFAGPVTGDPIEGSGADRRVRPQLQHMCGIRGVVSWLRNVGPWRFVSSARSGRKSEKLVQKEETVMNEVAYRRLVGIDLGIATAHTAQV
ncbi:MAG: hypothetical protein P1T08_11635, partial [Acidimicrobiia bacterium]|nr:hypothetical protein [Acidimicrobiia bacterium]